MALPNMVLPEDLPAEGFEQEQPLFGSAEDGAEEGHVDCAAGAVAEEVEALLPGLNFGLPLVLQPACALRVSKPLASRVKEHIPKESGRSPTILLSNPCADPGRIRSALIVSPANFQ